MAGIDAIQGLHLQSGSEQNGNFYKKWAQIYSRAGENEACSANVPLDGRSLP